MPISTISYLLIASFFVAIKIFLLKFQEMYFARMMVFMGIYHYTNAGTLPLILKNKTLRFDLPPSSVPVITDKARG
ncbi:hypothetical protein ABQE91_08715 [Xanthomonas campestris pv. campestris]